MERELNRHEVEKFDVGVKKRTPKLSKIQSEGGYDGQDIVPDRQ